MLLNQLRQSRDQINAACRRYGARRMCVFGSAAWGEERRDSDIAFLVELLPGYDLVTQRILLKQRRVEITGGRLDAIPEHEWNRHIHDAVLREAFDL